MILMQSYQRFFTGTGCDFAYLLFLTANEAGRAKAHTTKIIPVGTG